MKPIWTLAFLLLIWPAIVENWRENCPKSCGCTNYQNKRVVKCENMGFQTIPTGLSPSINVLNLNNNKLAHLESHAFMSVNLLHLHRIHLSNNSISSVDKDAFAGLGIVTDLDLSKNLISWLHNETFAGMNRLRKLILSGNTLRRLVAYQFPYLKSLQHLEINNCNLSYINNYAFRNLPNVNTISLKVNKLTILQPQLFMWSKNLVAVELTSNEWLCDCNLRDLVSWFQKKRLGEAELSCNSPQRLSGKLWKQLDPGQLACSPKIFLPKVAEVILVGTNATLACGASGVPRPIIRWAFGNRFLSNHSNQPSSHNRISSNVKYVDFILHENFLDGIRWMNLTINHTSDMADNHSPSLLFTCVVENPAGLIEKNASLYLTTESEVLSVSSDPTNLYFIVAVVSVTILILVILTLFVYCCTKRVRRSEKPQMERQLMERNNILIVNPMENSPPKVNEYAKVPQADLTDLSHGSHHNFEEMNYPDERHGRIRSPLTILEEEEFDLCSQKLLDLSGTTTTTLEMPQYPDLLDTVRFPRAVSPTQLSYHSLVNPASTPSEWRYSFAYAPDSNLKLTPQSYMRPGYVTLPRRPRSSSVPVPPTQLSKNFIKLDPIYDTLGTRTTADGISRTDLRPMLAMDQCVKPSSPPSVSSISEDPHYFSSLPRSTPNLLEGKKIITFPTKNSSPNSVKDSKILPNGTGVNIDCSIRSTNKKKVPPTPPPKPSNKRSSVASSISEAGSKLSDRVFQDEGPDGTEV